MQKGVYSEMFQLPTVKRTWLAGGFYNFGGRDKFQLPTVKRTIKEVFAYYRNGVSITYGKANHDDGTKVGDFDYIDMVCFNYFRES